MIYKQAEIKINSAEYDTRGHAPKLHCFVPDKSDNMPATASRPAVVICPGGGYSFVSDREAEPIAFNYLSMGFCAFILDYSVAPATYPTALLQAAYSVAYVRRHADEFGINAEKIAVAGFSAGAHLAASLSVFWNSKLVSDALQTDNLAFRPNAAILSYPVITSGSFAHADSFKCLLGDKYGDKQLMDMLSLENSVNKDTPPSFIWHTYEDSLVPVENSLLYAGALGRNNIPYELHIYQRGGHGLSLANEMTGAVMPDCQNWIEMSGRWLKNL